MECKLINSVTFILISKPIYSGKKNTHPYFATIGRNTYIECSVVKVKDAHKINAVTNVHAVPKRNGVQFLLFLPMFRPLQGREIASNFFYLITANSHIPFYSFSAPI
jgi:hypothetical protein